MKKVTRAAIARGDEIDRGDSEDESGERESGEGGGECAGGGRVAKRLLGRRS
jgi:hypothetical protein